MKYPSVEKEFDDDERIQNVYYPEVEKLLKEVAGAKRVFIFDHTIRCVPCGLRWQGTSVGSPLSGFQAQARGRKGRPPEPRPRREYCPGGEI